MKIHKIFLFLHIFFFLPVSIFAKPSLDYLKTYANAYFEYTEKDLRRLKKFDIVVIDPYDVPDKKFVEELKKSKTIVLAYLDVGEAEKGRIYFRNLSKDLILKENQNWPGNYLVNVNDFRWHKIILDQAIPYLFKWGKYDGLMLDMLDVVDEYPNLKPGMISLIKKIRRKYPRLLIVPNRGFAILSKIYNYIDAFKYEEMCSRYDFKRQRYIFEDDKDEQRILFKILEKKKMPVLVLDHLKTSPKDYKMAKKCFKKAKKFSEKTKTKFIWYGNSVRQDLPIWNFIFN